MKVSLIFNSPLILAIRGARKCYDSMDKSDSYPCPQCAGTGFFYADKCSECDGDGYVYGDRDIKLIKRLIKDNHTSVIEHIYYTFEIDGISRALLQELVRHRIASYSVKSTRYTLKELKELPEIGDDISEKSLKNVYSKYLVFTGNNFIDDVNIATLSDIVNILKNENLSNDQVKYLLPEAFKTSLIMTINARSLRNLFELRMSKRALKEFQELAKNMYEVLPEPHKILFEDIYKKHIDKND